jgi:NADH-quinone oxidoreductase subunit L
MVSTEYWLLALIPLLPAAGALFNGLLGSRLPRRVVHWVACGTIGVAFLISLMAVKTLLAGAHEADGHKVYPELYYRLYEWFGTGALHVDVAFFFDPLAAVMCLVVTGVGFLIHVYSVGYMHGDRSYARYFTYLNLFAFAMLILVLADNLVLLFVGWEGVGLASFLLIGFWYEDPEKAFAGKKAFIVNRIGDFAVLLALFMLFSFTGTFEIPLIRELLGGYVTPGEGGVGVLTPQGVAFAPFAAVIGILLFIGCTGKSAQIPLFTWLPDAMAGPTPVSALIHAATMVTAGVYLVARMSFLFVLSDVAMMVVAVVGVLTALMAATIGMAQNDIKRVLAYSTVSQLGFMFVAVGVGAYAAGIFHLMTHAFFKALLFLGSGAVIHALHGEQDIRKMGGLRRHLPITHITFLIGCIAISGVPLFSGFFSKDEILWGAFAGVHGPVFLQTLVWVMAVVTAGITAFYMFRLYFLTFHGEYRGDSHALAHLHRPSLSMATPLVVLAVLSLFGGYLNVPEFVGGGAHLHHWLSQSVAELPVRFTEDVHLWEWIAMLVSIVVALSGIAVAWLFYVRRPELPERATGRLRGAYTLVKNKYYVDELYDSVVVRPLKATALGLYKVVDRLLIDTVLVHGFAALGSFGGRLVRMFQNGDVQRYAFFILFGLSLMILLVYTG